MGEDKRLLSAHLNRRLGMVAGVVPGKCARVVVKNGLYPLCKKDMSL